MKMQANTLLLRIAFFLTGIGNAVLGAALPAMLLQWHLSDRSGGTLLFSAFAGSTLGAVLVLGALRWTVVAGLFATAAATLALSSTHGQIILPWFFVYGLGLGLTMTAISMLRSREVSAQDSNLEMNRLNLIWALGACCAPALALHSLHLISVSALFRTESATLTLAAVALLVSGRGTRSRVAVASPPRLQFERFAPVSVCLFAAAAVGAESAIGSWLTTYTERIAHGAGIAVWANSAFWLGLLLSRAAHSLRWKTKVVFSPSPTLHLLAIAVAVTLLIAAPYAWLLPGSSLLAGFGLGPLYPYVLSIALPRFRSGAVFVMAGLGSAVFPWLTGVLSTSLRSLRWGLLVPGVAVGLLLLTAGLIGRYNRAATPVPA